ncbi:MAG: ABC transporter substrate-binding protein, partial [Saprospiraceae bacterium]|nr:ABC transporter substrate-binding protein [Saprospiraceae bacterium]
TLERALDPETAAAIAGTLLGPVKSVEALDERTLVITLTEPFFPLLINLAAGGYLMPLSQAAVQAGGFP